jgi:hypothetical protein
MFPGMTAPAKPYLGRTGMNLTAWLLLAVAAASLSVAVVLPLNQLTQPGGTVAVSPELGEPAERPLDLTGLPEGVVVVDGDTSAALHAGQLPAGLRALTELPAVLTAVAIAAGAWWLARVLADVRAGRPFDRRNPARLAGVAAAVLLGGLVAPMSEGIVTLVVLSHLDLTGPEAPLAWFSVTIPFTPIVLALLLLAAAEAFRRGGALADDVDGLV